MISFRTIFTVGFFILPILLSGSLWSQTGSEVSVRGDTVHYRGEIDKPGYANFLTTVEAAEKSGGRRIRRIVISSENGDPYVARMMGEYIFDRKMDVEIDTICFFVCANYLFPAAKNKIIRSGARVGWYSSEDQIEVYSGISGYTYEDVVKDILKQGIPVDNFEVIPEIMENTYESVRLDKEFFNKIGVDIYLIIWGLDGLDITEEGNPTYQGWTYTIEDMAKFGVGDVTYLGVDSGRSYPDLENQSAPILLLLTVEKVHDKFNLLNKWN